MSENKKFNLRELKDIAGFRKRDHFDILSSAFKGGVLFDDDKKLLIDFINSFKGKEKIIKSQLYQDVFADFVVGKNYNKTFLEFGAKNGLELSNTYMLENNLGWKGALAEPSPQWHDELKKNRPSSKIITDCIWKTSGDLLDFLVSNSGAFSTLDDFKYSDFESLPGNTAARNKSSKLIKVKTISLNDVIEKEFNGICPSYLSVDTEGSEFEILNSFDFKKYSPFVLTVEHNFTSLEKKIDDLMKNNNYERVFRKITAFDAWYVCKETLNLLRNN